MVRLREIPRTAAFAWSSGPAKPLLVTGTRAGAVDDSFSDEVKLELWDLNLDSQEQGLELQPIASITTDSKSVLCPDRISFNFVLTQSAPDFTTWPGDHQTKRTLVASSPAVSRTDHYSCGMLRSSSLVHLMPKYHTRRSTVVLSSLSSSIL